MTDTAEQRVKAEAFGAYIKSLRIGLGLTLRDVEEATGKDVSNAYLSQVETGKIVKPSPNILHSLSSVYRVSYAKLMERAGYIVPTSKRVTGEKHGRAATYSIDNLSADEETELLKYLAYFRSKREKS